MRKSGGFFPCLCWRANKLVVEPRKRAAVQPARHLSQGKCFEPRAVQKDLLIEEDLADSEGQKNAACVAPQHQCCGTFQEAIKEWDRSAPSPTKTPPNDTPENKTQLPRSSSSGSLNESGIIDNEVQMAVEAYRATIKESEKPSPEERARTVSQESTMAEEVKGFGGYVRNCSQETETRNDTGLISQAVARVPLASKNAVAGHPVVEARWPVVEQAVAFEAEGEGVPGPQDRAGQSEELNGATAVLEVGIPANFGPQNTTAPSPEKNEREVQQQLVDADAKTHPTSRKKMGSSRQKKTGRHCEQEPVQIRSEKARSPAAQTSLPATGGSQEEDASSEEVGGLSQASQNAPSSTGATQGRRKQKRKKSSKTKGKRRYGKTGRR